MGVSAIFVSVLATTRLPVPHSPPEGQAELLAATLQTIVSFVVLGSILIRAYFRPSTMLPNGMSDFATSRRTLHPVLLLRPAHPLAHNLSFSHMELAQHHPRVACGHPAHARAQPNGLRFGLGCRTGPRAGHEGSDREGPVGFREGRCCSGPACYLHYVSGAAAELPGVRLQAIVWNCRDEGIFLRR